MSVYMQRLLSFSTRVFDDKTGSGDKAFIKGTPNAWSDLFEGDEFYHFLPRKSLSDRVHFIGAVSDNDMPRVYAAIDCAVHPYLNTRALQSGSGPATFAVEMAPPSLYTNAPVFREMRHYFPYMETFNVGNYLELASKILTVDKWCFVDEARKRARDLYNPDTMCAAYCKLIALQV
jgi:glycosyltransferase involved in cell wall biosynthesis